jgi:hypothetical protein
VIGGMLVFVLVAVVLPLFLNEAGDLAPFLARRLLGWGVRRVGPSAVAERYEEELAADLEKVPGKLTKLAWVCDVLIRTVPRLRRQFRQEPRRAWLSGFLRGRRRITYRVHLDAPIVVGPGERKGKEAFIEAIPDASLALVRVSNGGRHGIEADDIKLPLSFTFDGRNVLSGKVLDSPLLAGELGNIEISGSTVALPKVTLARGDSFSLLVLLTGNGAGVSGRCLLKGGRLMLDNRHGARRR